MAITKPMKTTPDVIKSKFEADTMIIYTPENPRLLFHPDGIGF